MSDTQDYSEDELTPFTPTVNEEQNFTETLPMYSDPVDLESVRRTGLFLARFSQRVEQVDEAMERFKRPYLERFDAEREFQTKLRDKEGRTPEMGEGSEWARVMSDAIDDEPIMGNTNFARAGSDWRQSVEYEGVEMGAGETTINPKRVTNGSSFAKYIAQKAKVGTGVNVPLWHSGIWVHIDTPPAVAVSNLRYQLGAQKVALGMQTKGAAFSGYSHTITMLAVDFTLEYITKSNYDVVSPTDFKEVIAQADIPVLLWGMAMALYPNGFHYSFPCISDPKCDHVTTRNVNLRRMKWEDTSVLTKNQKRHMKRMFQTVTKEDLRLYREEFEGHNGHRVWFDDFGVDLKYPTIYEYDIAAKDWINEIVDMSAGQYNEPVDNDARRKKMDQFAQDTTAAQYRHWVKAVVAREDEQDEFLESDESVAIDTVLKSVFSTNEWADRFISAVERYIADTKITAIALSSFECPKCKKEPDSELYHPRFPHLIEVDVVSDFFTLLALKQN